PADGICEHFPEHPSWLMGCLPLYYAQFEGTYIRSRGLVSWWENCICSDNRTFRLYCAVGNADSAGSSLGFRYRFFSRDRQRSPSELLSSYPRPNGDANPARADVGN